MSWAVLSTASGAAPGEPAIELPILFRATGFRSLVRDFQVLRSQADVDRLTGGDSLGTPPAVPKGHDWGRHMLLMAASGRRVGQGFSIRIERVEATAAAVTVIIKEVTPDGPRTTGKVLHPTDMVVVERRDQPVRFVVNGHVERVARPESPTSTRPAESHVAADPVLSRFNVAGADRERLEAACAAYLDATRRTIAWAMSEYAQGRDPMAESLRRHQADSDAFDAVVREVLKEDGFALYQRGRAVQAGWRQARHPLLTVIRNPATPEDEKRARLEQVRLLDTRFMADLDALFRPAPATRPAVRGGE